MCEVLRSCELCNYVFVSGQESYSEEEEKKKPEQYQ